MKTSYVDVQPGDIDRLEHVNNSVYLRWVEAAVHAHWMANADAHERAAFDWIAVRHEIDYRKPALLGERLAITVALTSVRRARAWYATTIHRGSELIAEAVSCWCCIDVRTGRLTVVPAGTIARFETPDAAPGSAAA